jgi:hypothetical protein
MGDAPRWVWLDGLWRVLSAPFHDWGCVDYLAVGLAALILSEFARHALGLELGYAVLSWPGIVFVGVGLYLLIKSEVDRRS